MFVYMKRLLITIILTIITLSSFAQQQRLIVFGGTPWFNFDPLTSYYNKASLVKTAGYVEAWRGELDPQNVFVSFSPSTFKTLSVGYRSYNAANPALFDSISNYLGITAIDTTMFKFPAEIMDTLKGEYILVVDRFNFLGDITYEHKVFSIKEFPYSKKYLARFEREEQEMKRFFATPILSLPTDYSTRDGYFGPSPLSNLIHSYQLDASGADISIYAPSLEDFTWKKGDLYLKNIHNYIRFDNSLAIVQATGRQLIEFLEEVYWGRYYTVKRTSDDMVKLRTPYFFHDSAAGGISYEVNLSKSKGKRIENHNIDLDKTYSIAMNSFRAKWFAERGATVSNKGDYRTLFVGWIAKLNSVENLDQVEHWVLKPQLSASEIKEREIKSLF